MACEQPDSGMVVEGENCEVSRQQVITSSLTGERAAGGSL